MRYLLFFFVLFLHSCLVFATDPPIPSCTGQGSPVCKNSQFASFTSGCLATSGNYVALYDTDSCWAPDGQPKPSRYTCNTNCSCPEGSTWYEHYDQQGNATSGCAPDDLGGGDGDDDQCPAGQVFYAGFCRDAEDSPEACGSSDYVSVDINGSYVCTTNTSCAAGEQTNSYSNANGSWTTCSPPSGDGNSSQDSGGGNSSAPSSASGTGSGGDGDSGNGSGGGNGSGNGSGDGTGNGSGNSSSSPSDTGSGSGDEGIGNGTAAAANCNDNEPDCDGDPIQCAMLVQLWINNCAGYDEVELSNPVDDNEAIRDNFDALMSSAEPSVNAEGVLDAMTPGGGGGNGTGSGSGNGTGSGNGSGNGGGLDLSGLGDAAGSGAGGTCPADRAISLGAGNFSISYQFFCDFASQISGLVILIFSYIGGMIIYRSLQW